MEKVMTGLKTIQITVTGRVQGVGYRYFCQREALELNLTGWARNMPDGSVTLSATGGVEALDEFVAHLKRGPRLANVENVIVCEHPKVTEFPNFETY
jgi:acylphosphatase